MILRRDLLSIANWHSLQHLPITSSRFPSGHPAHRCYETAFGAFTKNNIDPVPGTSSKLSQRSPIFFCKMRHCCSVLSPGHPTSSWIRRSTWNRGRWQGGTSGCGKLHKGTKEKRNFTLMDPQMVRMFRNNIQFCQFRRSISLSHTDDACFPWTNHMCSSATWSA